MAGAARHPADLDQERFRVLPGSPNHRAVVFRNTVRWIDPVGRPSVCYDRDMPVTAKLSREFYDRLGDKVVDELVGC
jgi:hypothetical protein